MPINAEEYIKSLAAKGIKIPPQPRVLLELKERMARGNDDVRGLARVISSDPGISAMLFKAASSPVFCRGKKLETLSQVLTLIGVKQVYSLVQAVALSSSISVKNRKALDTFWARSHEIAHLSAIIAQEKITVCNVFAEQAYMAGIFYDCGVPVLMQRFPDYCSALQVEGSLAWPDLAVEDARFNADHCTIGYLVARHWNLPGFICDTIRYRDYLPQNETCDTRSLSAILFLANHYSRSMNRVAEPRWPFLRESVLAELGIMSEEEEEAFEAKVESIFGQD